jgi:hypothetical protein
MRLRFALSLVAVSASLVACGDEGGGSRAATGPDFGPAAAARASAPPAPRLSEAAGRADTVEVEATVARYVDAVARGDMRAACATLARSAVDALALSGSPDQNARRCPRLLERHFESSTPEQLRRFAGTGVAKLRLDREHDHGGAVLSGSAAAPSMLPMLREDGIWKLAALSAVPYR